MSQRTATIWTFAITSLALFMTTLDNLVVTTALPVIRKDLDASLSGLEWTVNAYTLTFAVLLITGAALGDRFGRRRMFGIGLAIFGFKLFDWLTPGELDKEIIQKQNLAASLLGAAIILGICMIVSRAIG